jgi:hypothetical protein
MTTAAVIKAHRALAKARRELETKESELSAVVSRWIAAQGGVRASARLLGFSAPYLSDLSTGKRKVSDPFIQALREAK